MRTVIWRPGFSGYIPFIGVRVTRAKDRCGWTAEVVNEENGRILHTTREYRHQYEAEEAARRWATQNDFDPVG